MSRNLVKQYCAVVQEEEKRIIDTNELLRRRRKEQGGDRGFSESFLSGLETVEVASPDEGAEGSGEGTQTRVQEDGGQLLERAREEAEAILEEARGQAEKMAEDARIQAEVERNRVLEEARQQGYTEGLARANAEGEAVKREYQEKERQMEAFYRQQVDVLEPQLVDVITDVYQHVFHVELDAYRDSLVYLIEHAMRSAEGGRTFLIHVSREDHAYVSGQREQIVADTASSRCEVEVVEDVTLSQGQCLIETDNGIFDCGLGTQLEELKRRLKLLSWSKEEV